MNILPDEYTRRARLYPVVLLVLPIALAISSILGGQLFDTLETKGQLLTSGMVLSLIGGALLALAGQVGRAGRRHEPYLFHIWGGAPLAAAINGRGSDEHRMSWMRIRQFLVDKVGAREETMAESASDRCRDLETELKSLTRDKVCFLRVLDENIHYGFRRNMYGLKSWGVGLAIVSVAVALLMMFADFGKPVLPALPWATLIVSLVALVLWRYVTPGWVRVTADAYVAAMRDAGVSLAREARESSASRSGAKTEDAA